MTGRINIAVRGILPVTLVLFVASMVGSQVNNATALVTPPTPLDSSYWSTIHNSAIRAGHMTNGEALDYLFKYGGYSPNTTGSPGSVSMPPGYSALSATKQGDARAIGDYLSKLNVQANSGTASLERTRARTALSQLWRARIAASTLPLLQSAGRWFPIIGAGLLSWQIGRAIGDTVYAQAEPDYANADVTGARVEWRTDSLSGVIGYHVHIQVSGVYAGDTAIFNCTTVGASPCDAAFRVDAWNKLLEAQAALTVGDFQLFAVGSPVGGKQRYRLTAQDATAWDNEVLNNPRTISQTAPVGWSSNMTTTGFNPSGGSATAIGSTPMTNGVNSLDDNTTSKQVGEHVVTGLDDADYPDPLDVPFFFEMPDCIGLTYAACVDLLEALGYLGSITESVLTWETAVIGIMAAGVTATDPIPGETYPVGDPIIITRNPDVMPLIVPSPEETIPRPTIDDVPDLYPSPTWAPDIVVVSETLADPTVGPNAIIRSDPVSGTRIDPSSGPDVPVTVYVNPPTVPPVDEGTDNGINFHPVSDIDWGCKFPFGLISCYALAVTEFFDVAPDAPSFTFTLGPIDTPVGELGLGSGTVDLEVADDYMAMWRSILSVALWIGAVYYVASRFLGFNAGGDPGEAIDDVL